MTTEKATFCRICEPLCPLLAEVDDSGEIVALKPNKAHPTGGIACHKGLSFLEVHNDPDRLDHPLKRTNSRSEVVGEFEPISWDDALNECAHKLKAIRDEHGPNAIAVYYGNPLASNSRLATSNGEFIALLGTDMKFSASSQDMTNRVVSAMAVYGSTSMMVPDIDNTDYLLCLGANPRVSKWTVVSTPNSSGKMLENIKKRGGKVRFVNPRKTESSTPETGPTLLIKPGTDVYFLAAVLNEIHALGKFDRSKLEQQATGLDSLFDFVKNYPAERVTSITGISVEDIKTVAADIVAAKSACVYNATGVNQGRQGILTSWLAEMINFVTGNLGRKGGSYKPTGYNGYFPTPLNQRTVETSLGSYPFPKVGGYLIMPGAMLTDFIEAGEIKALISVSGNPLMTIGGGTRMRKALEKLDTVISIDISRNATAEVSDYVFAGTDFLERADINFFTDGYQTIPHVQYTDPVVEPKAGRRDDWWILSSLAERMGLKPSKPDDDGFDIINRALSNAGLSVEAVKDLPHHTHLFGETDRGDVFEKCVQTEDKKLHCYPAEFEEAGLIERCAQIFQELEEEPEGRLKLISLRTPYMHNSWLANVQKFRRGTQSANPLNICSSDASSHGLLDGDWVKVFNDYGSIETRIAINDELRPGAVAMTHGYGSGRAGMRVAEAVPGVNYNELVPTGPEAVEPLSYMSWMCGVPVNVEKVQAQ